MNKNILNGVKRRTLEHQVAIEFVTNGFNRSKLDRVMGKEVGNILDRPHVKQMVADMAKRQLEAMEATPNFVLSELVAVAGIDIGNFVGVNGELDTEKLLKEAGRAVSEYVTSEVERDGQTTTRRRVKLHDKLRALELLGRHLAMFTDKVQIEGLDTLAEEMKAARERVGHGGK